ncbi:MAG TPA: Fe-S cluster assembly protein SufD [Mycobacteriales bacterium]|jgi:Fe-S cluster assembly protein SufD|nr:Fe-S cluster assembly protein SufD [Mycobacteriales bacterium]
MTATTSSGAITAAPGQTKAARGGGPGAPAGSRAARLTSRDPDAFGLPTGREEEWRFTPLDRFDGLLARIENPVAPEVEVRAPDGVEVSQLPVGAGGVGSVLAPADRVSVLALVGVPTATVVSVPADTLLSEPVLVTVYAPAGRGYGHLLIDVGAGSVATVVVEHTGGGTLAANTELRVGDNAALTFVSVQDAERTAVHVEAQAALVGRDARLREIVVTLGGDVVRLTPSVRFAGPGGDADLAGVFFTSSGQHHEHQLFIDHQQPQCRSRVTYKGALQGADAHSVWVGDVLIGAAADGTDTYELNRNLLLTEGARADSVPNLEIETGDVTNAGHASATGRFDEEQLFYCMARGIPADEARRLVVRGFFADLLDRIEYESLRDRLATRIDALLTENTLEASDG